MGEHSSYSELKRFLKFLRIKDVSQVVPTVNRRDCQKMEGMFKQWIDERKKQGPDSQPIQIQKKLGPDSQQIQIKKQGLESQRIQIDSGQIERVLKQQSLVEAQGQRRRSIEKATMPQQGEDVRNTSAALLGEEHRRRSKEKATTCKDLLNSPSPTNASLPQQQGEDVRNAALLGVDKRHRVESNNSTCSVA